MDTDVKDSCWKMKVTIPLNTPVFRQIRSSINEHLANIVIICVCESCFHGNLALLCLFQFVYISEEVSGKAKTNSQIASFSSVTPPPQTKPNEDSKPWDLIINHVLFLGS